MSPLVFESMLHDKRILITGGTGSLGHALTDYLLTTDVAKIVILSRDENKQKWMRNEYEDSRVQFVLRDVRNLKGLRTAFNGVDIVIHAAALKHVDKCERDPDEAILTNVIGSRNVRDAAICCGVEKAILVSSDKAVNPENTYGVTKRLAERLFMQGNQYAAGGSTRLSAVRYGNVLASRGSVIEVWNRQRQSGAEITVTDPCMTRFWLTLDRAVELIMAALGDMRGGEIYIPRVGSLSIGTLAEYLHEDYPQKRIDLAPGEKMHEVLISTEEMRCTVSMEGGFMIVPEPHEWTDREWAGLRIGGDAYCSDQNSKWLTAEEIREMIE